METNDQNILLRRSYDVIWRDVQVAELIRHEMLIKSNEKQILLYKRKWIVNIYIWNTSRIQGAGTLFEPARMFW